MERRLTVTTVLKRAYRAAGVGIVSVVLASGMPGQSATKTVANSSSTESVTATKSVVAAASSKAGAEVRVAPGSLRGRVLRKGSGAPVAGQKLTLHDRKTWKVLHRFETKPMECTSSRR